MVIVRGFAGYCRFSQTMDDKYAYKSEAAMFWMLPGTIGVGRRIAQRTPLPLARQLPPCYPSVHTHL